MSQEPVRPYTKSLNDELDWKLLDQLHSVVAQISSFCFEIKKFCVTTLFVVMAVMVKFTSDKLDHSIFVAGFIITTCFWFLDSTAYFYQVKLRGAMESIRERIASRGELPAPTSEESAVIDHSRVSVSRSRRVIAAGMNPSMLLYVLLWIVNSLVWVLYCCGIIK